MSTKNKQIQQLIKSNDELENYFRNTIIPQLFVDAELKLQKFTPPAMKQFTLSFEDIGRPIQEIKDNFRFPSIIESIETVIKSNQILEKEIQTTDLRWYQMNILPYVRLQDNKTDGVIMTFVDITMRVKDLKDLEKLIADYEILLDTISHDIKNPLANVVMAMELLKKITSMHVPEYQTILHSVDNAVAKMHKVITELTEVRQNEHKYKPEEELLNIEHIIEDARLALNDNIINAGITLSTDIHVSELFFSRRKLRTVVYNLINNAIKFRSPEHKADIKISTYQERDFTVISVKDNGIGIEESEHEAIFTKYYRSKTKVEGTGIGLYLVKEIITKAGGNVSVNSHLGKGSEFKVYIKNREKS